MLALWGVLMAMEGISIGWAALAGFVASIQALFADVCSAEPIDVDEEEEDDTGKEDETDTGLEAPEKLGCCLNGVILNGVEDLLACGLRGGVWGPRLGCVAVPPGEK